MNQATDSRTFSETGAPIGAATFVEHSSARLRLDLAAAVIREMRLKHWPKNLIVFAPLLFSGHFNERALVYDAAGCFISFCLISSGIYVVNDLVDVTADRQHPIKRNRPIASGALGLKMACVLAFVLVLAGFVMSFACRPSLSVVCLSYLSVALSYSLWLKRFPVIDAMLIAAGFLLRAVAGAVAVKVWLSSWFLVCTSLGALFLALEKRRQELLLMPNGSLAHRASLKGYSIGLLTRLESLVLPSLLTSYALWSFQAEHGVAMLTTFPFVLYGIMRYQYLSEKGTSTGAPEEVLWNDRPIQITLALWIITCALIIYGHPADWMESLTKHIDSMRMWQ